MSYFERTHNARGYGILDFKDAYDCKCNLQYSSAVVPHVWLGVADADPQIKAMDTPEGGIGWVPYHIPKEVLLTTRMHLNRKMSLKLGLQLIRFAIRGRL